jgi:hypothetical protein
MIKRFIFYVISPTTSALLAIFFLLLAIGAELSYRHYRVESLAKYSFIFFAISVFLSLSETLLHTYPEVKIFKDDILKKIGKFTQYIIKSLKNRY